MQPSSEPLPHPPANLPGEVDTLVVGAGQAGLALSYWLGQTGVEHQLLERREGLGGAWQDRWDAFCLNTPNFSLTLPGMPYAGPEPEAFMPRNELIVAWLKADGRVIAPAPAARPPATARAPS